ncbi:MAG: peptidylprolyl isomerase [Rhodospirillales bacterium]
MFPRFAPAAALTLVMMAGGGLPVSAAQDPVVAIVNGHEIHLSQVKNTHARLPEQYQQIPFETIFPGLIDSLIDVRLAAADARRLKLHEEQEFKDRMARLEEQILQRMVLARTMKAGVSDADIKKRFESLTKEMSGAEQIQARHILLDSEDDAKAVIKDLKKGVDFADLARKKSTGPSASSGGDLGLFSRGQMVPEFEEVAFKIKKGEFTETPVKTQFGWHVIKVEDRKKADPPSFDELEPTLRNQLSQEAGADYIKKLRSKAEIKRFNADGSVPGEAGAGEKKKP